MDWKDDLGQHFGENGIHRLDYMNNQLSNWCKEWSKYQNEFDGIHADCDYKLKTYKNSVIRCQFIEITNKQSSKEPFQAYIGYFTNDSGQFCLYLKITKTYYWGDPTEFIKRKREELHNEEYYIWDEEEKTDDKIFVQEDVLQILNNRLKNYFNSKS